MPHPRTFDITIYAPSGRLLETKTLSRAEAFLLNVGHRVHIDPDTAQQHQRFAGDDVTRLAAVHRVLHDTDADIALAARGGYGWTRLLKNIDYSTLARDKKIWVGHSDFTAFQLAALTRAQRITFAGPMACYDFGAENVSMFTVQHCFDLLSTPLYEVACTLQGDQPLETAGTLWGGNLSIIAHLIGTPYFPSIDHGILFLEDINEAPYRIERLLYQLHLSGVLAHQRAVLLGNFTGSATEATDNGYTLDDAIAHLQKISGVPFYRGLPFGHIRDKLTLPVGAPCKLTIDQHGQSLLAFRDYLPLP